MICFPSDHWDWAPAVCSEAIPKPAKPGNGKIFHLAALGGGFGQVDDAGREVEPQMKRLCPTEKWDISKNDIWWIWGGRRAKHQHHIYDHLET